MATYKVRGNAYNVVYPYFNELGEKKQIWETYATELEAKKRKAYIDSLQKNGLRTEITKEALAYRRRSQIAKAVTEQMRPVNPVAAPQEVQEGDNARKTYRDFAEKWLPFHVRKERLSPNTYDSYKQNLETHILPYFGEKVMSQITAEDVDDFLDYLSRKPCKGPKSYGKAPNAIPTLSSSSIKKCYVVLTAGFPTALKWGYIKKIPETAAPVEKTQKRRAWSPEQVSRILDHIKDDKLLHLAIHLGFVCSLREGEVTGIDLKTINLKEGSLWISRQVQRVSDASLRELPKEELVKVFPKKMAGSKSSLILKSPKTAGSHRKQYLTIPLMREIAERLEEIQRCKDFFREEYQDDGLLICQPDGTPLDPCYLVRGFRKCQQEMGIPESERIDFQGLRKSGQMHKVRLTQNNYQLVADNAGQSPEVLMSNYNEVLDSEKRALAKMVEASFYPDQQSDRLADGEASVLLQKLQQNPDLIQQLLQSLLTGALQAQRGVQHKNFPRLAGSLAGQPGV